MHGRLSLLKRVWAAWRTLLAREDARWDEETGLARRPENPGGDDAVCEAQPPPSLSDLVSQRQAELRRD